jgi:hypothetical protein
MGNRQSRTILFTTKYFGNGLGRVRTGLFANLQGQMIWRALNCRGGLISKNGIAAIYREIVTVRLFVMTNVVFVGSVTMMVYITRVMAVWPEATLLLMTQYSGVITHFWTTFRSCFEDEFKMLQQIIPFDIHHMDQMILCDLIIIDIDQIHQYQTKLEIVTDMLDFGNMLLLQVVQMIA